MTDTHIAHIRLLRQQILQGAFREPAEVVAWHGAMQAQDFAQAKWVVGLRLPDKPLSNLHLLAAFDEFLIAYRDRSASLDPAAGKQAVLSNGIFKPVVVVNGSVKGIWGRTVKRNAVEITQSVLSPLSAWEQEAFVAEAERFGRFLGQRVVMKP